VVQRREEVGNPIDVKLKQVADELHNVVVCYLQVSVIASYHPDDGGAAFLRNDSSYMSHTA
jgi:hypothetical protein